MKTKISERWRWTFEWKEQSKDELREMLRWENEQTVKR